MFVVVFNIVIFFNLMLCSITKGWLDEKNLCWGNHLLYVILFYNVHWHRYMLYFFCNLIFFLSLYNSWFSLVFMKNFLDYILY